MATPIDFRMTDEGRAAVRSAIRAVPVTMLNNARRSIGLPDGFKINDLGKSALFNLADLLGLDVVAIATQAAAKADFAENPVTAEYEDEIVADWTAHGGRGVPVPAPSPLPSHASGDAAAHLAALMGLLAPKGPAVDLDAVRKIVAEEVAKAGTPRPLAITVNDAPKGQMPATRHAMAETLLAIVAQNVPAYLVGPAGAGKTTAAEQVAQALGLDFYMTGAVMGTHEYLGFIDAHGAYHCTPFRAAFENGGVFLADEIDGSDPAATLVLNAALANGVMPFPDQTKPVPRHADFRMIAAANTFGQGADRLYVGRNQMDASTLDRFAFISWGYDEPLERQLSGDEVWARRVQAVRKAAADLSLRHVVSPRASMFGAKLLKAGMKRDVVEDLLLWKGLKPEDVTRLKTGAK